MICCFYFDFLCITKRDVTLLYKSSIVLLQNGRSRRSVTGPSHTRNGGVEHVQGHGTANDDVIMGDHVIDPARKVGHEIEADHVIGAGHVTEVDHATEATRVIEIVTVVVGVTGISITVEAEAEAGAEAVTVTVIVIVIVIDESVTMGVTMGVTISARRKKCYPPRPLGKPLNSTRSLFVLSTINVFEIALKCSLLKCKTNVEGNILKSSCKAQIFG